MRQGDPGRREAVMTFIDAASVEDALAMFLAACPTADLSGVQGTGGAVHVDELNGKIMWAAWRGRRVVVIVAEAAVGVRDAIDRLGGRVLLATPGAAVPTTLPLRLLSGQRQCDLRMVRSVAAITSGDARGLRWNDPSAVDRLLGLSGDLWLLTAGFSTPAGDEMNYVFAVRYPSAAAAADAHSQCAEATARGELDVLMIEPMNDVLVGSWTPDVESVARVLPALRRSLEAERPVSGIGDAGDLPAASR
jgi:hypothetical protein